MLIKHYRFRITLIFILLLAAFLVIEGRLYYIQVVRHEHFLKKAKQHQVTQILLTPTRGDIIDTEGCILATNLSRMAFYVYPKYMSEDNVLDVANSIGPIVRKTSRQLRAMMKNQTPVALGHKLDHAQVTRLNTALREIGLTKRQFWFSRENERIYPNGQAGPILGYCATTPYGDNDGIAGIEMFYDERLKGKSDKWWSPRSATNYLLETIDNQTVLDTYGDTLQMTIHAGLQNEVEKMLREQVNQFNADSGITMVMDVKTGAIRAMACIPTFDPNRYEQYPDAFRRNITVTDPIEIGSVMKILTASILVDTGAVTPDTLIDCEGGYTVIRGRVIKDAPGHVLHVEPFRKVFAWSSNVGFCKAAQAVPKDVYHSYLRRFGLGQKTGVDLNEDGKGILYPLSKWSGYSMTSLPMGYETALTPLQTVTAVAAVANGGQRMEPYLVEKIFDPTGDVVFEHEPQVVTEVCKPATAEAVLSMMREAVEHGTGDAAKIPGYSMGGKTGTTQKSHKFKKREYISSFASVLPLSNPQIVIYSYINNPKGAKYGGDVAAPLVRKVALASVKHLHIPPDEPIESLVENKPDKHQSVRKSISLEEKEAEEYEAAIASGEALEVYSGLRMPDLTGKTLSAALRELRPLKPRVSIIGAGVVKDQSPPALSPIKLDALCVLTLERPGAEGEQDKRLAAQLNQ